MSADAIQVGRGMILSAGLLFCFIFPSRKAKFMYL
jgi:hypothetical protein